MGDKAKDLNMVRLIQDITALADDCVESETSTDMCVSEFTITDLVMLRDAELERTRLLMLRAVDQTEITRLTAELERTRQGWKPASVPIPKKPHREVYVAYHDAKGRVFGSIVSSRIANAVQRFAWTELPALPEPPQQEQAESGGGE